MSETDVIDHPLDPETVVEYQHPNGSISTGEVIDCWKTDGQLVYDILDFDYESRPRIKSGDIKRLEDADTERSDGVTDT